ncbi:hypothetical protein [Shewanella frigidimarina]|uniref:Uncharacterized protein n=1 Tax=Shewanella frigidimarina (strain NCIMB 400) TaxID=318167 RepID=Q07ZB5_SHEFN|nr:hypothetical protein [Shewanella frigidimarina]ABI72649.1 hypothetical protein Sfri_2810 [Shewanella frigidimarina NCIMB 400]
MDLIWLLGLLAIYIPIQMCIDAYIVYRTDVQQKGCDYLLAFIPLLTFAYPEHYLYSFISLVLIVLYGISLRYYAAFNDWLDFDQDRLAGLCLGGLGVGGIMITASLIYQFLQH